MEGIQTTTKVKYSVRKALEDIPGYTEQQEKLRMDPFLSRILEKLISAGQDKSAEQPPPIIAPPSRPASYSSRPPSLVIFQSSPWVQRDDVTFKKNAQGIASILGHGSSAAVFDGFFQGQRCAIKVLNATNAQKQLEVERFQKEIEVLFFLNHPNICRTFGGCMDHDPANDIYPFMILELLPYKLGDVLAYPERFPSFTDLILLRVFQQTCDALAFLHNSQPPIFHRDLKPDNIMLTLDFSVKLVDFGLVKVLRVSSMTIVDGGKTRLVGTSCFMV
jgi:serine/threonine protein kinase